MVRSGQSSALGRDKEPKKLVSPAETKNKPEMAYSAGVAQRRVRRDKRRREECLLTRDAIGFITALHQVERKAKSVVRIGPVSDMAVNVMPHSCNKIHIRGQSMWRAGMICLGHAVSFEAKN
jgi:hypothetical protein